MISSGDSKVIFDGGQTNIPLTKSLFKSAGITYLKNGKKDVRSENNNPDNHR